MNKGDIEQINQIKLCVKRQGIDYCYGMPKPANILFYCLQCEPNKYMALTNEDMAYYFSKYTKWKEFFVPYHVDGFYVTESPEIEQFLISKYHSINIKKQLGQLI